MPSPESTVPEFLSRSADRIAPDGSPFRAMVLEILIEEYRRAAPEAPAAPSADADALAEALRPFESGGNWGRILAWIVEGAPDRSTGIAEAAGIVRWQVAVNAALAAWDARRKDGNP